MKKSFSKVTVLKNALEKKICYLIIFLLFISIGNYNTKASDVEGGLIYSSDIIFGAINTNVDSDSFTFDGIVGQTVVIVMSQESSGVTPYVALYSPDALKVAEAGSSWYGTTTLEYKLESSGQFTIFVSDAGSDGNGNYSLSLQLIPGDTQSKTDADGGLISSTDIIYGKIDLNSDSDCYVFNGIVGQSVVIVVSQESSGVTPYVALYSPDALKVAEAGSSWYGTTTLEYKLESSGQFTIFVSDAGSDGNGNYSLSFMIVGSGTPGSSPDDVDGDGIPNTNDKDDDNDGYTDFIEGLYGTDPLDFNSKPADLDKDGIPDSIDDDDDNDGYTDIQETYLGTNPNDKNSYPTNIEKQDSDKDGSSDNVDDDDDNDGYTDLQELYEGTNPIDATSFPINIEKYDSDGDGIPDSEDTDDDNDGMTDIWELFYGLNNLLNDAQVDLDTDKYYNIQEFNGGTNPRDKNDYPGKSPSIFEHPAIRTISLVSTLISLSGLAYAYVNRTVWRFRRGINKSETLKDLQNYKEEKIQPAIESKKLKPKQVKIIMKYCNEKEMQLREK